jgi:hypothetical protein
MASRMPLLILVCSTGTQPGDQSLYPCGSFHSCCSSFSRAHLLLQPAPGCKALRSCDEAQRAFKAGDQSLDRDDDGIPCENLCKDPTSKGKAKWALVAQLSSSALNAPPA